MYTHEVSKFFAEDPILDERTGLAINSPLSLQLYPGWMEDFPETVSRIRMLRATQNIEVDDFPNMEEGGTQ